MAVALTVVAGCAEEAVPETFPLLTAPAVTTTTAAAGSTTSLAPVAPTTAGPVAPSPPEAAGPDCEVTLPTAPLTAPPPYPADYPFEGHAWYGTADLWTLLSVDGVHSPRKSVWWSAHFPGGAVEEQPDVRVTWTRLDADPPIVRTHEEPATNAYTPEEGWFMIAGFDPDEAGCWQVEATYKGATLGYVYERG